MQTQDGGSRRWKPTPGNVLLMSVEGLFFVAQVVLSILYYNFLGLQWLLYLGWGTFAVAMLVGWRARVAFQVEGAAREGESWLHTREVVDTGIYGLVRHPMYLSFLLTSLSLVFLALHWLNALSGAMVIGLLYNDMCREERNNLKRFGTAYQQYMEQVPRMNLLAGIVRRVRRSEKEGAA